LPVVAQSAADATSTSADKATLTVADAGTASSLVAAEATEQTTLQRGADAEQAQGRSARAAAAQRLDTTPQAPPSGPAASSPKRSTGASGDAAPSLSASASGQSENVAGAATAPAPRSATGTSAADATIVREAAISATVTANVHPPAATAPGAESEHAPTQRRADVAHLLAQAGLERAPSGTGAISPTQPTAPAQTGEAGLTPTPAAAAQAAVANPPAGVALQDMIESIHATIELAARQGMTQARIALEPADLGSVRVHLSQTADGLLARVSADTPAAAQALAGGRAELHESLSSLGISLLRLDIDSFGQPEHREPNGSSTSGGEPRAGASAAPEATESEGSHSAGEPQDVSPTRLSGSALVDVLA
jgi:flagellar hook-length control protein FliK